MVSELPWGCWHTFKVALAKPRPFDEAPSHRPGFKESVVPADKAALIGVYGYR